MPQAVGVDMSFCPLTTQFDGLLVSICRNCLLTAQFYRAVCVDMSELALIAQYLEILSVTLTSPLWWNILPIWKKIYVFNWVILNKISLKSGISNWWMTLVHWMPEVLERYLSARFFYDDWGWINMNLLDRGYFFEGGKWKFVIVLDYRHVIKDRRPVSAVPP